ncbi:MAG: Nif3-like dinuclear metal center hexameric protein [bacterium]
MILKNIILVLETFAPLQYQEEWDNSGLIIGSPAQEITGIMVSLDTTPEVLDEAIRNHCNLIVSHHPLIFHGLKKITPALPCYPLIRRVVQNDIAVYAMHTSLDNLLEGLNSFLAKKIGLQKVALLTHKSGYLKKLVVFCPTDHAEKVRNALFEAGAGHIGDYDCCSYNVSGQGTFRASEKSNPFVGAKNVIHFEDEIRIEVIFPSFIEHNLVEALLKNHPYEEVAYDLYPLTNKIHGIGAGVIGHLPEPMDETRFIQLIKPLFRMETLRHSATLGKKIRKVAISTGAGAFLIHDAIRKGADTFLTADLKYHSFQEVEGMLLLIDIGHYESEHFMKELISGLLIEKFPNFAILISESETNPVKYFNS